MREQVPAPRSIQLRKIASKKEGGGEREKMSQGMREEYTAITVHVLRCTV